MMKLQHKFVNTIPENLESGIIYISMDYGTAIHKCCCGCGKEVVTPFSPQDWEITFNGKTISLFPSIDNEGFPCKSHYWIRRGNVEWVPKWKKEKKSFWKRFLS